MRPDSVLSKTVRGRHEIDTREHALSAMQRRLLILANGERTVAQMAEMLGRASSDPVILRDLKALAAGRYLDYAEEVEAVD